MDIAQIIFFIIIGFVGGVWNALAGGATLFTFPALMYAGLPPVIANATNYLALLPANVAALPAYRKELKTLGWNILPMVIISGLGAICGALLLLVSDPEFFMFLIPFLIFVATMLFAYGNKIRNVIVQRTGVSKATKLIYLALFIVSIYGGFFGAGLSIILLAIAQIMGYSDLNTANGIKNLLAASFTILSIFVFGFGGLITWSAALTMMVGSTCGGFVGGRLARRLNQALLRYLIIMFGLILTLVYFIRTFG